MSYAGISAVVNAKSEHIDVVFDQHQIMVRDPKGMHNRTTMLLLTLELPLHAQLQAVKHLHERDLASGHGEVSPALCSAHSNNDLANRVLIPSSILEIISAVSWNVSIFSSPFGL